MNAASSPLRFLGAAWFAPVMGVAGLSLAWHRAGPFMGEAAGDVALALAFAAAVMFAGLAIGWMVRAARFPEAMREDFAHPVRHPFVAAVPVSAILLATAAVALDGPSTIARGLWMAGSLAQLATTTWVIGRWWRGNRPDGLAWASLTPAMFIPVVGNVLVPLAGVPLGHADWSAAQFAMGAFFWPVVQVLVLVRLATQGPWPERLQPAVFIFVAPPAVIGLALVQFGAPIALGWGAWGIALLSLLAAATQLRRIAALPFSIPHWALSFPLAAFATLTLRLATPGTPMATFGVVALAVASLVVGALLVATFRGIRDGTLLAPEPVAQIQVATPA
ncbi:MAG: SLAC1 anion channel family protein [Betaproteobacteria bacterium]|nr:SLAC1 anion channel family protein [Betaproteobacteria bacterium]